MVKRYRGKTTQHEKVDRSEAFGKGHHKFSSFCESLKFILIFYTIIICQRPKPNGLGSLLCKQLLNTNQKNCVHVLVTYKQLNLLLLNCPIEVLHESITKSKWCRYALHVCMYVCRLMYGIKVCLYVHASLHACVIAYMHQDIAHVTFKYFKRHCMHDHLTDLN